ncbi:double-strand break repair protein AddB [Hyphomonas sp.]|uniref:double-strand break repair protein AddB n=1 Tax=Hyphomonas sp. TaxID=87 RepID=UPI00391A9B7E
MAAEALFGDGAPRVRSIPPGAAFLKELARALASEFRLAERPDALADAIVYVPNKRSARGLLLALFDASGGAALLPPDIRAMGDLDTGDPPPVAEQALAGAGPRLSGARRLGVLAALARKYYLTEMGMELTPAAALSAARELSELLRQAAISEGADWEKLRDLEIADVAGHWERAGRFLRILTEFWPDWLNEQGVADPYSEPVRTAEFLLAHWEQHPPAAPVIIAGSTGATPDGRLLMRAALRAPRGLIVLPGLDMWLEPSRRDGIVAAPGHPQNALLRTLQDLGLQPEDVAGWPGTEPVPRARARIRLIQEALAPADATADWRETLDLLSEAEGQSIEGFVSDGLSGLSVVELPDEASEARAAALLMRKVLDDPGETAALVTPDAGLARRVSALLGRWGISVPPSAPVPLGRTSAGSLIGLCARWAADPGDPGALAAVLKHPFVSQHLDTRRLDLYFLRGPRRWTSLEALARRIETLKRNDRRDPFTEEDQTHCAAQVRRLDGLVREADADFSAIETMDGAAAAEQVARLAGLVSATPMPWTGEDGAGASRLLQQIAELAPFLGPMTPQAFADLIDTEAANQSVPAQGQEHPRLRILGPLEARLQSADRIILTGLNEDVWPQRPSPDSFLPRQFRKSIGLLDPEERMGLSAHDFAQLASAPQVVMLHAARRDDSPAVASRWVWRLRTLATAAFAERTSEVMQGEARDLAGWVAAIENLGNGTLPPDYSAEPKPSRRTPTHWPARLSVTRVDLLQRDPYALWAEDVLGLKVIDPINKPLAANLRGTAIHAALEAFEKSEPHHQTADHLLNLIRAELAAEGEPEESWLGREAIWQDVAAWYLRWRSDREQPAGMELEAGGNIELEIAGAPFRLSAMADRVEWSADGRITVVDYKTGTPPSDAAIAAGFDQQMPLQALIARSGGFKGVAAGPVAGLEYVSVRGKPSSRRVGEGARSPKSLDELVAEADAGLVRLISQYRAPEAEFASAPRVQFVKYDYGFNLLARRAEWNRDTSGGEGGDE